jgi:hypothetical protein
MVLGLLVLNLVLLMVSLLTLWLKSNARSQKTMLVYWLSEDSKCVIRPPNISSNIIGFTSMSWIPQIHLLFKFDAKHQLGGLLLRVSITLLLCGVHLIFLLMGWLPFISLKGECWSPQVLALYLPTRCVLFVFLFLVSFPSLHLPVIQTYS